MMVMEISAALSAYFMAQLLLPGSGLLVILVITWLVVSHHFGYDPR